MMLIRSLERRSLIARSGRRGGGRGGRMGGVIRMNPGLAFVQCMLYDV